MSKVPWKEEAMIPGYGNEQAKFVIVGEAPGAEEEKAWRPFVGYSGKVLYKALEEAGISPDECYFTNVVKVKLPKNRTPTNEEISYWSITLFNELMTIQPMAIVTLGGTAAKALWSTAKLPKLRDIRGHVIAFGPSFWIPTYHPSYLRRSKTAQVEFVKDLILARETIETPPNHILSTLSR